MFVICILSIAVESILWETRVASFQLLTLVTYVKCLNSDLMIHISKKLKTEMEETEKEIKKLCWMKDFKK